MREFFKPWRRKIGVAVLLVACALTVGWIRSFTETDLFALRINQSLYAIESSQGELGWQDFGSTPSIGFSNGWSSMDNKFRPPDPLAFNNIHYWTIVIPLAALSAYLLLSKPKRKA